jgi:hypothetical protein
MRTERGIPQDFERETENMAKRQQFLHIKGDIFVHVWEVELLVCVVGEGVPHCN